MSGDLREQLMEAKRNLTRQLEVLQSPSTVNGNPGLMPPDTRGLIAQIQQQLREINEAIAGLDTQ